MFTWNLAGIYIQMMSNDSQRKIKSFNLFIPSAGWQTDMHEAKCSSPPHSPIPSQASPGNSHGEGRHAPVEGETCKCSWFLRLSVYVLPANISVAKIGLMATWGINRDRNRLHTLYIARCVYPKEKIIRITNAVNLWQSRCTHITQMIIYRSRDWFRVETRIPDLWFAPLFMILTIFIFL